MIFRTNGVSFWDSNYDCPKYAVIKTNGSADAASNYDTFQDAILRTNRVSSQNYNSYSF